LSIREQSTLRKRLSPDEDPLRVLLLTNEHADGDHPGHRDAFARLLKDGSVQDVAWAAPNMIATTKGVSGALHEVLEVVRGRRSNVIVQMTTHDFPVTKDWFDAVASSTPSPPVLLAWEGDAWSRWGKPINPTTELWWRRADAVFSVAIGAQRNLIQRHGGRDVRLVVNTYDHIRHQREEATEPDTSGDYRDVVMIANWWGNRFYSRLPGARQRGQLVRRIQKDTSIPLALYGLNWTGRGVRGTIPAEEQAAVARAGLITANWDHFPRHAGFSSNRLSVQLLAGRPHVTTLHPSSDWLPGPEAGLFLEPTVEDAFLRIRELLARPKEEVLELGLSAHRWARHRISDRELALYMLGAVDERLLRRLPGDPWSRLPS